MSELTKLSFDFISSVVESLPEIDEDMMKEWIDNPVDLQNYLHALGSPHDTIVRIDRSIRLVYKNDGHNIDILHPELEVLGPSEYDLAKIKCKVYPGQKRSMGMSGNQIYKHLRDTNGLRHCLGLQDAIEITKKGLRVFRKLFDRKSMYCWRSIAQHNNGELIVPVVHEIDGGRSGNDILFVDFGWVSETCHENDFSAQWET